ncbi:flippase [Patescibacteria group bacterium]|nr:flippase [Patescibacteria group bacterium]MBU1034599.1 flippase [Patescibacteria group bacterium]MBU1629638.1 flippase [Patescibacteria group bacterium]MBU1908333.1 flippase [Patescibacteria group bacterium]
MAYGAKIAKNAAWLMFATAGQKVVAFVAFTIAARLIGREQIGVFFYCVSITSIFVIVSDLGMTPVIIRAIAGKRADAPRLFQAALRSKMILAPLAIIGALAYALLFKADGATLLTVAIACLVMTADTFHLAWYGTLRGVQNLKPEAVGMFVGQIFTATGSIAAAYFGFGPVGLATALLAGSLWNVFWAIIQAKRLQIKSEKPRARDYKRLAKEAVPFGLAGLSVKVYSYVDSLFLNAYHGSAAVGAYAVAYKLTYALQFLPLTFTAALYPALASAYAEKDHENVRNTFLGSLRLMAAVAFPLSAALSALAPRLIPLIYGADFIAAIPAFTILPWVLLPIFLDFPVGALLNATHRAHLKTTAMVITMLINIALNAALVPFFGPKGAAWAGVMSFWTLFLIGAWLTRENAGGLKIITFLTLRGLLAAFVAWAAWALVGSKMILPASIVFGGSIAVILAFLVKLVTVNDVIRLTARFRPAPEKIEITHEE